MVGRNDPGQHMLRLGGGTVRLTDTDGSIVEAKGEVIAYSAETAHMFEQSAIKTIAFQGSAVLKEDVERCWEGSAKRLFCNTCMTTLMSILNVS